MTRDLPLLNLCEITQSLKIKLTAQKQAPANKKTKLVKETHLCSSTLKSPCIISTIDQYCPLAGSRVSLDLHTVFL
jgi:hypothetical protein